MLLYDIVSRGADRFPERTAIIHRDGALTYGELAQQVNRCASGLRGLGVGPGDRVAVLLPNGPYFTVVYYAVTALGALCVPANPLLKPPELAYLWGDCGARAVITAPLLLANVEETRKSLPAIATVVSVGDPGTAHAGVLAFDDLLASGSPDTVDVGGAREDDPAVCIYTSGTTGHPKGALLSHRNLTRNCEQVQQALEFDERDNFLCVLPLFHSFAGTVCQNTPLYCGARMTILELFHPARVFEAIAEHGVTVFPGVPTMYGALLHFPLDHDPDFSRLRLCVSGGAPMPVAVMQAFEKRFDVVVIEGDGPTECSPVTSVNPLGRARKPGTIGTPVPGVEMRIFDDDDREVPDGEVGEIVVRGDNVMLGYLNQPEATAEAMRSGWYHTGDLGTRDADGYFSIVDRKKDMLIVGGINVYPREVEEVLYTHPAVADAAVVGAPDALRGEQVVAVVALKPGAEATARDLIRYCRERLANYKVPRAVVFRAALTRGSTGKVLKRLLRKEIEMEVRRR